MFNNHKYKLFKKHNFNDHSIYFLFVYDEKIKCEDFNKSIINDVDKKFLKYFNWIYDIINVTNMYIKNNCKKFVIFPSNLYIQYLICLGLNISDINYFYDNNLNKLDKFLYRTDIMCKNLDYFVSNNEYEIILLGFLYNDEISRILEKNNVRYYIPLAKNKEE